MSELDNKWVASDYLDDGRWGVLAEPDYVIVIGASVELGESVARKIAEYHNNQRVAGDELRKPK